MLIAALVVLLTGVALSIAGLRGRRTDDHPLCRRCRFDLTGRPDTSERCPECGADVTRPRAVVVGHRRRLRKPLLAGLLVSMLALLELGATGWQAARDRNWWETEPLWLLLRQASSADPAWRTPALAELSDRAATLSAGQLDAVAVAATAYEADAAKPWERLWGEQFDSAAGRRQPSAARWGAYIAGLARQATSSTPGRRSAALDELMGRLSDTSVDQAAWRSVVATGLDVQGDPTKPWLPGWGTVLERAHADGRMTDAQCRRYADQAMPPTMFGFRVRPRVRRGDPLPYWLDEGGARGPASTSSLRYTIADAALAWDDRPAVGPDRSGDISTGTLAGTGRATGSSVRPAEFPPGLPDGPQHVRLTATATVREVKPDGSTDVDPAAPPLVTRHIDLPATFDLRPADQPTVQLIHDPTLAAAIQKSLTVDSVTQPAGGFAYVNVVISVNGPPVGLAFRIVLIQDGREIDVGTLACPAGTRGHSYGIGGAGRLSGPTVDVVLRGDSTATVGTTDAVTAWDGTLVFKGVSVTRR